jgi:hypothetical protein
MIHVLVVLEKISLRFFGMHTLQASHMAEWLPKRSFTFGMSENYAMMNQEVVPETLLP